MGPNAAKFCNVVQSFGDVLKSVQDLTHELKSQADHVFCRTTFHEGSGSSSQALEPYFVWFCVENT